MRFKAFPYFEIWAAGAYLAVHLCLDTSHRGSHADIFSFSIKLRRQKQVGT